AAETRSLENLLNDQVRQLFYRYDFGDNWLHLISIEGFRPEDDLARFPAFLEGSRSAPPEDCGGTDGFRDFLRAISDPAHINHQENIDWFSERYGHTFDPDFVNRSEVELGLRVIGKSLQ
ncbi:MAG: plasmid pRiA4b ORF-3 family protein, partial [Pseudomonadota bacterium]